MAVLSRLGHPSSIKILIIQRTVAAPFYSVRLLNYDHLPVPPKAKHQMQLPGNPVGHMKYERYWSRDKRYKPQPGLETDTGFRS